MTGHHGWGYGQNDGRHRPWPAGILLCDSRPAGFPGPASPPLSWPDPDPTFHPAPRTRPTCPARALAPLRLAQSLRCAPTRPAASCAVPPPPRSLRPPDSRERGPQPPAPRPPATHSPISRGPLGRGGLEQRGRLGKSAVRGCGMRCAHVVCAGTSRESVSAWARAQCPRDSVPAGGVYAYLLAGT